MNSTCRAGQINSGSLPSEVQEQHRDPVGQRRPVFGHAGVRREALGPGPLRAGAVGGCFQQQDCISTPVIAG